MAPNIALVGMSCRFPGNIFSPEEFWRLISEEGDAIGGLPDDRGWAMPELYSPEPGEPGKLYIQRGYFLRDVYRFDAGFFGMGPREARATDPQQRINLELSWEALERAGIDPLSRRGTRTGVFVGAAGNGYDRPAPGTASGDINRYWGTGNQPAMISGRVAYALGLEGPAMTVDTGCSSSLVALHLARRSLLLGECDLALVGGITVMMHPDSLTYFSGQRAIAPDGNCKPFAAGADGTSFAEGAGVLVLERLPDARRLGHPVLAVVKGSALSQDGATSSGLTIPSTHAQRQVIRAALRDARLGPCDIDAVEAHGTGTIAGDPVEARAITDVYGHDRGPADPLWVGSVKSNIGHAQWAAGIAGIMKMTLAMRHGVLPRTLHVDRPAPDAVWDRGTVRLQTERVSWPRRGRRRAGVSSFGISGTNAHVILEESPRPARRRAAGPAPVLTPILLSAKTDAALRAAARRLAEHPSARTDEVGMADLGHALAATRSRFERRAVILAREKRELRTRLRAFAAGEHAPGVIAGATQQPGKTVFVFPGQGAQWPGMAAALIAESPVFARQLAACDEALAPHVGWSLTRMLRNGPHRAELDRPDVVQPALFATAVSLAALWRSLGVEPDAVVGHSQGEIAAAYVCGALDLDDAARISALRGKAVSRLAGKGAMASIALGEADVRALLAGREHAVAIAAVNGPGSTVVAGPGDAVDRLLDRLADSGVTARRIPVAYASHCAQVEEIQDELEGALSGVSAHPSGVRFYSTVTGGPVDAAALDGGYWWSNLRLPVRFADATRALIDDGFRVFIEASPHPILGPAIGESLDEALPEAESATVTGSLRRQRGGLEEFLANAAKAHVAGVPVGWDGCFDGRTGRHVDLPTYPFQRKVHKLASPPRVRGGERAGTREDGATAGSYDRDGDLFRVDWTAIHAGHQPESAGSAALIGPGTAPLSRPWRASGHYASVRTYLDAIRAGAPIADFILTTPPAADRDPQAGPAADAHATAEWALGTLQDFLAEGALADSRLVVITHLAVSCGTSEPAAGFAEATVVGLVRSAQSEDPGRVVLLDADHSEASARAIPAALATGEPQLAIREGRLLLPRLAPARPDGPAPLYVRQAQEGTFLITGGTGSLGRQVARHLVTAHGARHLLLVSRQGAAAPGARELTRELASLGATVRIAACDVTDPSAVRSLIAGIPAEHALTGVLHTAAALENDLVPNMTAERLHTVLAPKVEGTWNLYQATRGLDLRVFVLFSSVAATLGMPGQGNYAAANSFLDSLAAQLRGKGVPALALAWGNWATDTNLLDLTPREHARLARNAGLLPLAPRSGLGLLDRATRGMHPPLLVAARFDGAALRAQREEGMLRPLLYPLAAERSGPAPDTAEGPVMVPSQRQRPRPRWADDADAAVRLVTAEAAIVLGYSTPQDVKIRDRFQDLGIDSLGSRELSHRLSSSTGLRLPATLAYDYPTPGDVAAMIQSESAWQFRTAANAGAENSSVQETAVPGDQASPPAAKADG